MSILVTGGTGYIGSHTVVELLNLDKEVIIVDNFSNSNPTVLDRIRAISNKDFKFYKVDKARTRAYGGNGIGLSIVKAIMDRHNKECGVVNKENGVEFWFRLDCNNSEERLD